MQICKEVRGGADGIADMSGDADADAEVRCISTTICLHVDDKDQTKRPDTRTDAPQDET